MCIYIYIYTYIRNTYIYTYINGGRIDANIATTPTLEVIDIECLAWSSVECLKNKGQLS